MEEEKQEVLAAEPKEEKVEAAPAPKDDAALRKNSLMAFIFALVGLALCETVIGGIVFGALGLSFLKKANGIEKKPFSIFNKVTKPVAIVAIILGALFVVFWILYIVLVVVLGVVEAAAYSYGAYLAML